MEETSRYMHNCHVYNNDTKLNPCLVIQYTECAGEPVLLPSWWMHWWYNTLSVLVSQYCYPAGECTGDTVITQLLSGMRGRGLPHYIDQYHYVHQDPCRAICIKAVGHCAWLCSRPLEYWCMLDYFSGNELPPATQLYCWLSCSPPTGSCRNGLYEFQSLLVWSGCSQVKVKCHG